MGYFERRFQTEGGVTHKPLSVSEWQSDRRFVFYQNIRSAPFSLSKSTHVRDRETYGHTDKITTPKTALAYRSYSRAVKPKKQIKVKKTFASNQLLFVMVHTESKRPCYIDHHSTDAHECSITYHRWTFFDAANRLSVNYAELDGAITSFLELGYACNVFYSATLVTDMANRSANVFLLYVWLAVCVTAINVMSWVDGRHSTFAFII